MIAQVWTTLGSWFVSAEKGYAYQFEAPSGNIQRVYTDEVNNELWGLEDGTKVMVTIVKGPE